MKTKTSLTTILLVLVIFSCTSPKYIHDPSSHKRQKELRAARSGNVAGDILATIFTAVFSAATDVETHMDYGEREFKNFKLVNASTDTMYVNMLTDASWDSENYCDFMDIRIPPREYCKILVPMGINYNIYFGITDDAEKDEFVEINTYDIRRIALKPGMTLDTGHKEE